MAAMQLVRCRHERSHQQPHEDERGTQYEDWNENWAESHENDRHHERRERHRHGAYRNRRADCSHRAADEKKSGEGENGSDRQGGGDFKGDDRSQEYQDSVNQDFEERVHVFSSGCSDYTLGPDEVADLWDELAKIAVRTLFRGNVNR